jgi:hypothetical protein
MFFLGLPQGELSLSIDVLKDVAVSITIKYFYVEIIQGKNWKAEVELL